MYNAHRGMPPGPPPPNSRLAELLEQVRVEFEAQGGRANEYEHQRESRPVSFICLACHVRAALRMNSSLAWPPRRLVRSGTWLHHVAQLRIRSAL